VNLPDFVCFQCGTQESITLVLSNSFATIFDVSEGPIPRLSYAVPFVSIIILGDPVVVVEKSGGNVQGLNSMFDSGKNNKQHNHHQSISPV
jgi:hypothetical protein